MPSGLPSRGYPDWARQAEWVKDQTTFTFVESAGLPVTAPFFVGQFSNLLVLLTGMTVDAEVAISWYMDQAATVLVGVDRGDVLALKTLLWSFGNAGRWATIQVGVAAGGSGNTRTLLVIPTNRSGLPPGINFNNDVVPYVQNTVAASGTVDVAFSGPFRGLCYMNYEVASTSCVIQLQARRYNGTFSLFAELNFGLGGAAPAQVGIIPVVIPLEICNVHLINQDGAAAHFMAVGIKFPNN